LLVTPACIHSLLNHSLSGRDMLQVILLFILFSFSSSFAQEINVTVIMTDPGVQHKGNWTDGVLTEQIGSSLSYSFNGTAFYMFMPKASSYGEGVIVFDGKSYPWNGFDADDVIDDACGLCLIDLSDEFQHNMSVTLTSHGQSTDPFGQALVVSYMIYTVNQTATPPNTFTYPGTSSSSSGDNSGSSPNPSPSTSATSPTPSSSPSLPIIIGAAAGGIVLILACGVAFYFYRRSKRLSTEMTHPAWERDNFAPMQDTGDRGYMQYRERVPPAPGFQRPASNSAPSEFDGSGPAAASSSSHTDHGYNANGQTTGTWVAVQQQQAPLSEKQRLMMAESSPYTNSSSPSPYNSSSTQQLLPPAPIAAPMSEKQRLAMAADSPYNNSRPDATAYPYTGTPSSYAPNLSSNQPAEPNAAPVSEKQRMMRAPDSSTAYPSSSQMRSAGGGAEVDHLRAQVARLAGLIEQRDLPPGYT